MTKLASLVCSRTTKSSTVDKAEIVSGRVGCWIRFFLINIKYLSLAKLNPPFFMYLFILWVL